MRIYRFPGNVRLIARWSRWWVAIEIGNPRKIGRFRINIGPFRGAAATRRFRIEEVRKPWQAA